jgi:hypothetical protein
LISTFSFNFISRNLLNNIGNYSLVLITEVFIVVDPRCKQFPPQSPLNLAENNRKRYTLNLLYSTFADIESSALNASRKALLALPPLLLLLVDAVVSSASVSGINSALLSVQEGVRLIRGGVART